MIATIACAIAIAALIGAFIALNRVNALRRQLADSMPRSEIMELTIERELDVRDVAAAAVERHVLDMHRR